MSTAITKKGFTSYCKLESNRCNPQNSRKKNDKKYRTGLEFLPIEWSVQHIHSLGVVLVQNCNLVLVATTNYIK